MPALRYPSQLVAPSKQVVYYPGALPYPYMLAGDEAAEAAEGGSTGGFGSWWQTISNAWLPANQVAGGETPVESASPGKLKFVHKHLVHKENIQFVLTFL